MKKKILSVLLSTALVGALLAGCGSDTSGKSEETTAEPETEEASDESSDTEDAAEADTTEEASTDSADKPLAGVKLIFADDAFNPYRIIGEDGSLSGYDFDVLAELQNILGFDYEFVETEFAAVLTAIPSGTADFAMTLTPKEERKEMFDFTQTYIEPKTGVGVLADSGITSWEDLKGKTVIAPSATTFAETAYTIEDANVIEMENIPLGCEEVVAGRADAILCDSVQLSVYAKEYGFTEFVADQETTGVEMLGNAIGFAKGSEYMPYFDDALTQLKESGKLTELQVKWLGEESATQY